MSADDQRIGLAGDLAARSDDELVALFIARPDLAAPPPQGSGVLGQRALSAASITLAGEDLVEQIRITLYHELGHYLGFEEEDMDDLGLE